MGALAFFALSLEEFEELIGMLEGVLDLFGMDNKTGMNNPGLQNNFIVVIVGEGLIKRRVSTRG